VSAAKKVVLAYSGGLDTSIIIPWLRAERGCEVHCVAGDVGQGAGELEGLEAKALTTGAASCRVVDLKETFLTECVWPALRALATYQGRYLLGTSLARPVLARAQVEVAREIGADALAHGCTGKGNDQVRFELAYMAFAPELEIIAPWRVWSIHSREDALDYARAQRVPVTATREKIYSRDRNLWHISHEGGPLEDPAVPPPDDVWVLTTAPEHAPDAPEVVTLDFAQGVPVALNGEALAPVALVERLNAIAGRHGVGRIDIVEDRLVGMKSRGLYETPAGTVLYEAARSLRGLVVERETAHLAEGLAHEWARLAYNGLWFHPAREALDAFFASVARTVMGRVVVRLFKGRALPIALESPYSLYRADLASFTMGAGYDPAHSEGFVRLFGLPGAVAYRQRRAAESEASR